MNGRSTTPLMLAIGATSLTAGAMMLPPALIELFRYSPYEDPGAGRTGLLLLLGFLLFAGLPVLLLAARCAWAAGRSYLAWKRTLTPGQRALLAWAELSALTAAHLSWRAHNRSESERLTASVMGGEYKYDPFPGSSE